MVIVTISELWDIPTARIMGATITLWTKSWQAQGFQLSCSIWLVTITHFTWRYVSSSVLGEACTEGPFNVSIDSRVTIYDVSFVCFAHNLQLCLGWYLHYLILLIVAITRLGPPSSGPQAYTRGQLQWLTKLINKQHSRQNKNLWMNRQ